MCQTHITLTPTPPFDFAQSLAFIGGFPLTRGEPGVAEGTIARAVTIEGRTIVFRVASSGTVAEPRLDCTLFTGAPLADALREAALDRIGFFLSTADDLAPFYNIGQDDPVFAPVIDQLYGYHHVKFLTPFESAAWAILAQRVQMPVARKFRQALMERFGGTLTVDGTAYRAFPTADRLATVNPDDLLDILPTLRKAPYLHGVARAFDDVDEQWLRTAPYDDVYAWLRAIPGIGEWSATFILIRGLGRMERVSTEFPLLRAAERIYGPHAGTPEGFLEIAAQYSPYQGYWGHYLRAAT